MILIAGLGNPGPEYAGTRHNIGFELIDRLASAMSVRMGPGKGPYYAGRGRRDGETLLLVKPSTYMNRSGAALQQALNWYKIQPEHCLVCYDDLDLPVGTIRLRAEGSAGGHNGMRDIIRMLGTDAFPRLRIGIGNEFPEGRQVDFVLSPFDSEERNLVAEALDKAESAVFHFCENGIEAAMNKYN